MTRAGNYVSASDPKRTLLPVFSGSDCGRAMTSAVGACDQFFEGRGSSLGTGFRRAGKAHMEMMWFGERIVGLAWVSPVRCHAPPAQVAVGGGSRELGWIV